MAKNGRKKSEIKSSTSTAGESPSETSSKRKQTKIQKFTLKDSGPSLVDTTEEDDELRIFSSGSIKTNSKIVNDVICDLSSLSSETMQANIELSEADKQRIEQFKTRHQRPRSNSFRGFRKRLVFDVSYFRTCSFFKQLFILTLSFLVILDSLIFRNAFHEDMLAASLQVIFVSFTILILIVIICFYLFHYVGTLPQNSWLICEFYIYLLFSVFYFVNTIIIFSISKEFVLQGVYGIFIFLNFFALALTKLMMAHLKITAQTRVEDPDGNLERAKTLNSRFAFPNRKLLRVWTV